MTKQFLLFMGYTYYPGPAWMDFVNDFDSIDDAKDVVAKYTEPDWYQIVDLQTKSIVEKGYIPKKDY